MIYWSYGKPLFGSKFANLCSTAILNGNEKLHALTLSENEREYPAHVVKIVDEIASLTLLEVADLNELLTKRLNIKVGFSLRQNCLGFANPEIPLRLQ